MSLNNTPSGERIHIGIFGKRNAGKSSLINALTGQSLAIVSDIKGTTTDPVLKAMELLPLGPVVMIDTPGLDDDGELGGLRIQKAYQILNKTDIAVLVVDASAGMTREDAAILKSINDKMIPCVIALNKADLTDENTSVSETLMQVTEILSKTGNSMNKIKTPPVIRVSAVNHTNIQELKDLIASLAPSEEPKLRIVGDLIHPSDLVVLVIPIDKAAPLGRLILPQQQTIRDILESGAISVVTRNTELKETLSFLGRKPSLVITDSQAFEQVAADVPKDIPLTSFSILFARYKGNLGTMVNGARALEALKDGDTVLISEGCTHHRQCGDIGTEKLPAWIRKHTGKELHFDFTSGSEFPVDLKKYQLIVHCGGCTLNEREMKYRLKCAGDSGVAITNYGTIIAYMKGILERSTSIFQI